MKIFKIVREIFFPTRCISCDKLCDLQSGICTKCKSKVQSAESFTVLPITNDTLIFPFYYEGNIRKVMHKLKFMGRKNLARPIAQQMAVAIKNSGIDDIDFITYVPIHELRLKERGYNQAELLARVIAEELNLPIQSAGLSRLDAVAQHSLSGAQRRAGNMLSFEIDDATVLGGHALLVDDIYTTGTTVQTISAILKSAGADRVSIAAAAYVRRS